MTRLFLAGGEAQALSDLLDECDVRYILYSFHAMYTSKRIGHVMRCVHEGLKKGRMYLMDSGSYTFQAQIAFSEKPMPFVEYRDAYYRFIEEHGHLFAACAELDLETVVLPGANSPVRVEDVFRWREEMVGLNPGARIMPVWHPESRVVGDWLDDCKDPRFPFLGIGGQAKLRKDENLGLYNRMIAQAHAHGKVVHGFGASKIKTQLNVLKYDSVDSTSWLASQKFGTTYIFARRQWTVLDNAHKNQRRRYRAHFTRKGIDWRKLEADDTREVRKAACVAWRDMSDYLVHKRINFVARWAQCLGKMTELYASAPSPFAAEKAGKLADICDTQPQSMSPKDAPMKPHRPPNKPTHKPPMTATTPGPQINPRVGNRTAHKPSEKPILATPPTPPPIQATTPPTPPHKAAESSVADPPDFTPQPPATAVVARPDRLSRMVPPAPPAAAPPKQSVPPHQRPAFVKKLRHNLGLVSDMPSLKCSNCGVMDFCPKSDPEAKGCAYQENMEAFPVRDADNLLGMAEYIVDDTKKRYLRARLHEELTEGGMPSEKTTNLGETVLGQLETLKNMRRDMEGAMPRANPSEGGGILHELFAKVIQKEEKSVTIHAQERKEGPK